MLLIFRPKGFAIYYKFKFMFSKLDSDNLILLKVVTHWAGYHGTTFSNTTHPRYDTGFRNGYFCRVVSLHCSDFQWPCPSFRRQFESANNPRSYI